MQAKSQRTVFIFIPKGKFHLVAVSLLHGAGNDSLPRAAVIKSLLHNFPDLSRFNLQLPGIRKILICTAAAKSKMGAGRLYFAGRLLYYLQKPALRS